MASPTPSRRRDLSVVSVLSGNRNFEGRIHPDVRMNYLASPPLVVAYALAGTMDIDLTTTPLGDDADGNPVLLSDLWPSMDEVSETIRASLTSDMFRTRYSAVFDGDEYWQQVSTAGGETYAWQDDSTYVQNPPYFEGMTMTPAPVTDIADARVLALLGDSVTTDHISPAGSIGPTTPAGHYLTEHGVERARLQLLRRAPGQPRGHDARHLRQRAAAQPAGPGHRGWRDPAPARRHRDLHLRGGHAVRRRGGARSSCWPAASTGRAAVATGRPRARRCSACAPSSPRASSASTAPTSSAWASSPCSSTRATRRRAWALTGHERFAISGLEVVNKGELPKELTVTATADDDSVTEFRVIVRIDTPMEAEYYRHGGILQYVLRQMAG